MKLTQSIFNAGRHTSNSSSVNITHLIPSPSTISRNINRLYEEKKVQLTSLCNYENVKLLYRLSYCGLALRHVTQDFKLQNFILARVDQSDSRHLSEPIRSDWNPIGFYRILSDLTELSLDSDTEDPTSIPRPGIRDGQVSLFSDSSQVKSFFENFKSSQVKS
ncbi:unnamed protein product [Rotaria socialis]